MKFKTGLKIIAGISSMLLFSALQCADSLGIAQQHKSGPQSTNPALLKAELSRYKTWTLVNPKPVLMDPIVATDCAAPNAIFRGPHVNKFISVYVNDAGKAAMMSEKSPKFPQGSIIVKEKLGRETGQHPELLTVMVKREDGYDRENGNWEYLIMYGDRSRVEKPANVERCQACHQAHKETDYVSRIYLPNDVRKNLK
jgi:hypothetical protein